MMSLSKPASRRIRKALHGFVTVVSSASIVVSSVSSSFAQSIIVDPSAPGTSFLQTSNGTPQVNIKTPQSGVSLNRFIEFNVGSNGLILNNSTTNGVSVIGQNVTANPNLMVSGPASTIVTEVTGTASSTMTGKTEVFGKKAAVIVANPNGIVCNGCAFLNTTSSTLTTGKPIVSGNRVDLAVTKGTVTIGPAGFQPGAQGGIIGRHVILTGPVVTSGQGAANDLLVSGGAQRVQGLNGSDLSASPIVAAPSTIAKTSPFAIDAAETAAIRGGDVVIRNPEAGQGVNLYGAADSRSFSASSGGNLFYKDINADTTVSLAGSELRQYGQLTAGGDVTINGRAFTLYDGRVIETAGDITITGEEFVVIAGEVSGDNVSVDVTTGTLTNTGFLMADGDLTVIAGENVSQQRQIAREYDIYFDPALQQYIQAYYAQLAAGGPEADLAAEMIERASRHELVAEYIEKGATATGTTVTIKADGDVTNEGGAIAATSDVRLTAGADILNTYLALRSRLDAEDGCSGENCGYRTDFHAGEILAGRDLILTAGRDIRNEASDIAAAEKLALTAGRDVIASLKSSSYTATGAVSPSTTLTDQETVLAPSRIMTLYGDLDIMAGRDLLLTGSLLSAGDDLTLDATDRVTLTSYTGVESDFRVAETRARVCKIGNFFCSWVNNKTVTADGTVLATATSNLVGDVIRVTAGQDLTLIGARLLAESDLSLTATGGAVLINGADLPGDIAREGSKGPQIVELDAALAQSLFGPAGRTTTTATGEAYIAFLQENDLLTAVEALRRAGSGADIEGAARAVGVQSYVSLTDNSRLDTLRKEAEAGIAEIWSEAASEIAAHDADVAEFHDVFRSELAELEDRLGDTPSERQADLAVALREVTTDYTAAVAAVETTYRAALAASQAQYGALLTRTERRYRTEGYGLFRHLKYYYVTVPNPTYVNLKAAADARALADRTAALNRAASEKQVNTALVRASFTDTGIRDEIEALNTAFTTQLSSFGGQKTALVASLNGKLGEAMRRAGELLEQEAESDGLRGDAVARGSVVEGEKSLASALTNQAFPELSLTENVVTTAAGQIENRRNGDELRTRLVTKTRDVGEYRDVQSTRQEVRYTYTCSGGGKGQYCRNVRSYVTVPVSETRWVVTGTEEYQAEESYLDGTPSRRALISSNKAAQDAFLNATAWRFGSGGTQNTGSDIPWNQLLANGGDLTLTASTNLLIEDGSVRAEGLLNTTSLGNTALRSVDVSAGDLRLVAGGAFGAEALNLETPGNASFFGATDVAITPRAWEYRVTDTKAPITGQLAAKNWGILAGQTLVSQELSQVVVGGDLDLNTLGSLTVGGTRLEVGNDVTMTASGDLRLTAPSSAIEYHVGGDRNGTDLWDVRAHKTEITAGGDVLARAGGLAFLEGTGITAQGGIDLASGGDLILSAAQDVREYRYRTYSKNWFRTKSYQLSETRVTNDGADLVAGGDIDLESTGGDLTTAGARIESRGGDINISATDGNIYAGTFTDVNRREAISRKSTFFGLFSSNSSSLIDTRRATGTGALASANLSLVSGGNTTLIGARLAAGGDLNLNVGGDLNIQAAIDSERKEFFESKVGAILATTETERSNRETAILTSLSADGNISFSVGGNTYLTLYAKPGEASASVADLYPEELEALAGLVLLDQDLLDEYFHDKTKALSPAFTMVLTIALTSGFGNLIGAGMKSSALATNTGQLTHLGKAVASMAASTTVGIANGTVSGELDLGQILRNAAISAGTSYLQNAVNLRAAGDTTGAASAQAAGSAANQAANALGNRTFNLLGGEAWGQGLTDPLLGFGKNLTVANVLEGAFDASIGATIQTAAYGGNFGDAFKGSFINSVVALGLADAQTGVGDVFAREGSGGEGSLGHVLLHGLAGCVAAEAQGADCAAGAAGGIAQAIYAGGLDSTTLTDEQQQQRAELIGAAAGWLFSGGQAQNVSTAASVALSGMINNRQLHANEKEILSDMLGRPIDDADFDALDGVSDAERATLAAACALIKCSAHLSVNHPDYAARVALEREGWQNLTEIRRLMQAGNTYAGYDVQAEHGHLYLGDREDRGDSGYEVGAFLYTGTDARYDWTLSAGHDIYGQKSSLPQVVLDGLLGLASDPTRLWHGLVDEVQGTAEVWAAVFTDAGISDAGGQLALKQALRGMDYADAATLAYLNGGLSNEEFRQALTDTAQAPAVLQTIVLGYAAGGYSLARGALVPRVVRPIPEIISIDGARFSQTTASPWFSPDGLFGGLSISDVATRLRSGSLSPSDVPVQTIVVDNTTLIVNTRSSLALSQAGVPRSQWITIDMTGDAATEALIRARLDRNGLTTAGTSTLRITGSGSTASTLIGGGSLLPPGGD
ncbi:MAG: hemagglutinin repeat-containing protein [Paracoccaceae bacterium]|nr:hemagglutinin repeat-containing protein [Paracoccaceae bacterium]